MFVSPEVDIVIDSAPELGLISSAASRSEEHLEPMFLEVVVKVAPSGLDGLEPRLVGVQMLAAVQTGQVLNLELPRVKLLLVSEGSKIRSVGELVGVKIDAGRPDLRVTHYHRKSLSDHLILIKRFVHNPCSREDFVGIDDLEEGRDKVGRPHCHQGLVLELLLCSVRNVASQIELILALGAQVLALDLTHLSFFYFCNGNDVI